MMSAFTYGGVVGNGEFCNRTRELADLTETITDYCRTHYEEEDCQKTSYVDTETLKQEAEARAATTQKAKRIGAIVILGLFLIGFAYAALKKKKKK